MRYHVKAFSHAEKILFVLLNYETAIVMELWSEIVHLEEKENHRYFRGPRPKSIMEVM